MSPPQRSTPPVYVCLVCGRQVRTPTSDEHDWSQHAERTQP